MFNLMCFFATYSKLWLVFFNYSTIQVSYVPPFGLASLPSACHTFLEVSLQWLCSSGTCELAQKKTCELARQLGKAGSLEWGSIQGADCLNHQNHPWDWYIYLVFGGVIPNEREYLGGGFLQNFYFHSENWGRWTHLDEHIFKRGWFNHQLDKWLFQSSFCLELYCALHCPWQVIGTSGATEKLQNVKSSLGSKDAWPV